MKSPLERVLASASRIAAVCSLLPAFLHAAASVSMGVGPDEEAAVSAAVKDALRKEVSQIVGESAYTKNRSQIESKIVSNPMRYTLSHKLLESQEIFGVVNARVRFEPNTAAIIQSLKESSLIAAGTAKPRIVLLLDERIKGQPSFEKTAVSILEQQLKRAGFVIVEADQLVKLKDIESTDLYNSEQLATAAFRSGADLILKGQVSVGEGVLQNIYGVSQYAVPVQLNVRVVRSDNAEVVVSASKTVKKNAQDEFSAGQIGLTTGGQTVGELIAKQLLTLWQEELSAPKNIEFSVTGSDLAGIESRLESLPLILTSQLRYMENKSALFDLTVRGTMQDLREAVRSIPGWQVSLVTKNRLGITTGTAPMTVAYEYAEPDISISAFTVNEIFPSQLRRYEKEPLASVTVQLKQGASVQDLAVSVQIPEIMDLPSEVKIPEITAGVPKTASVPLIMNSGKLLANRESRRLNGKAVLSFYQNGKKITRELVVPVMLQDANAMDWADASSIASFATYRNSTVDQFARAAVTSVDKTGFNDQFESVLAVYEALKKYGISYVKDPTPAGDSRILDKVQYPLETLEKKSGDCDDSSVLFASMLAALGIETAFISYPDHVLIMFDTGIYSKNRYKLGTNANSVVVHKERCWLPIETTLLKTSSFYDSWRTAAAEYSRALAEGESIQITELSEAWKKYPAFSYERTNPAVAAPAVSAEIKASLAAVNSALKKEITAEIASLESKGEKNPAEFNRLGILYARNGEYAKAAAHFKGAAETPETLNNLACAQMLTGDEKSAAASLDKALAADRSSSILINKALALYLASTTPEGVDQFASAMKEAKSLLPAGVTLEKMLGLELAESNGGKAAGEHTGTKAQTIDKRRMQELLKQRVLDRDLSKDAKSKGVTANVNIMPFGGVRGADPTQVAAIVDLLVWMENQ